MPFALWTRVAVRQLIQMRFGIEMPVRTVGEYLKRWGFTTQRSDPELKSLLLPVRGQ